MSLKYIFGVCVNLVFIFKFFYERCYDVRRILDFILLVVIKIKYIVNEVFKMNFLLSLV